MRMTGVVVDNREEEDDGGERERENGDR